MESGFAIAHRLSRPFADWESLDYSNRWNSQAANWPFILRPETRSNRIICRTPKSLCPRQALAFRQGLAPWLQLAAVRRRSDKANVCLNVLLRAATIDATHTSPCVNKIDDASRR